MPTRTVFETCRPRDEVLHGELREQQFAASLTRVLRREADPVYGDPVSFFQNTYPTSGLKALLREALGRLTGRQAKNAPVIRVETSFGGGKTHNLIGLLHVCRDPGAVRAFPDFMPADLLPGEPVRLVAGVVGGDLDPPRVAPLGSGQAGTPPGPQERPQAVAGGAAREVRPEHPPV